MAGEKRKKTPAIDLQTLLGYTCSAAADDRPDVDAKVFEVRRTPILLLAARWGTETDSEMLDRRSALDLTEVAPRLFARSASDTYGS